MHHNKFFSLFMIFIIIVFAITNIVHASQVNEIEVFKVEQFSSLPEFSSSLTYDERIQSFFDFLHPIIKAENSSILYDRTKLIQLIAKSEKGNLKIKDINWINEKAQYYKLQNFSHKHQNDLSFLLTRIDVIPELMVMSQAAIESAYGTSGFAKRANNLFGMRTLSPDNGIIPKRRPKGAHFFIAKYDTVNKSIQCYLRNLNTHKAYNDLRETREDFHKNNKPIDAYMLANGLTKYSSEGNVYVQKIRRTMKKHENRISVDLQNKI